MEKWEMTEPYPGAQVRVAVNGLYHHGIYIGNGEVVQFGRPFDMFTDAADVRVIRSPVSEFLNGGFIEVRAFDRKEKRLKRPDAEIIATAISRIGEGNYSLLYNNCEHFANFCVFGTVESKQVEDVHIKVRAMLGLNNK